VINADAVFGTQFRTQQTSASDITATSELGAEFSGTVELNNEIDPAQGLIDLPQSVVDPAALIAQDVCIQGADSEFVITGRGGLPPSPQEIVRSEEPLVSLIELPPELESRRNHSSSQKSRVQRNISPNLNQPVSSLDIVPARGWIRNEKGEVILVGYDPTKTGVIRQRPAIPHQCHSD
jgi:large exoprotein involved in heme utilization and adhesion